MLSTIQGAISSHMSSSYAVPVQVLLAFPMNATTKAVLIYGQMRLCRNTPDLACLLVACRSAEHRHRLFHGSCTQLCNPRLSRTKHRNSTVLVKLVPPLHASTASAAWIVPSLLQGRPPFHSLPTSVLTFSRFTLGPLFWCADTRHACAETADPHATDFRTWCRLQSWRSPRQRSSMTWHLWLPVSHMHRPQTMLGCHPSLAV